AITPTLVSIVFFFFQAEDGIRDLIVTGVQTCALPISECFPAARVGDAESWTACCSNSLHHRPWRPESILVGRYQRSLSPLQGIEIGRASCRERVESSVGAGVV